MTAEDLKKFDRKIRQISDPFGRGFPIFRQLVIECAEKNSLSVTDVTVQYTAWKWKR